MTKQELKKVLGSNGIIWAIAMITSFVLPMITDSITEGRGIGVRAFAHVFPLMAGMWISNAAISKAIGKPTDG